MSKNRNLADLLDSTGDVKSDALDNVSGLPDAIDVNASAPADSLNIASNGSVTVKPNIAKATDTATLLAQIGTNDASDPLAIKFTARTGQGSNNYIAMDCAEGTTNRDFIIGYNATERMRIDSSGKVFIGCTSAPSSSVHGIQFCPVLTSDFSKSSAGSTGGIRHIGFYNPNGLVGGIETNGSATIFLTSSDYRLKENVVDMTGAIDRVKALQPKRFNFIVDEDDTTVDGFLAHEVSDVIPEAISGEKDATETYTDDDGVEQTRDVYQGIDQSKLVPLLTGALQEAIAKIEALETRIEALENV